MRLYDFNMYLAALALVTATGCQPTAQPPASAPAAATLPMLLMPVGDGAGRIVSDPEGINCPSTCSAQFPIGSTIKLSAIAEPGWMFDGWGQGCSGKEPQCTVEMDAAQMRSFSFKRIVAPLVCTASQIQCMARCVDTTSDAGNCGDCGRSCAADQTCVDATCVSTGGLQISASWSRAGDGNLVVTTPNGKTIWWNNRGPDDGTDSGAMDRDDTTGSGPENIFWPAGSHPPSGTYFVCFEMGSFAPSPSDVDPIGATITVQQPGSGPTTTAVGFTSTTASHGTCTPDLDTFVTAFNYP